MFDFALGPHFYIFLVVVQTLANVFGSAQASLGAPLLLATVFAAVSVLVNGLVVAAGCAT